MTLSGTYHLPKGTSADGPYDLAITPESAGWAYSGLRILTLRPGGEHVLSTGENEFLVLPLNGGCTVAVDGRSFELGGRTDVFSAVNDFAYLPRESQAVISSADGGTYALPCARTERGGHSARYGRKEDVPVEPRGERRGLMPGGNWSSYPPPKNGFGCLGVPPRERSRAWGRVYGTDERPIAVLAEIRSGDTVLIPHGRHGPSIAAPGYDLYYLNVMAGPGQDRAWLICDDPAHSRVRDTWASQDVDDRLPFEGSRQR
ncbi:5-deoxy-glucuronate isomerase [Streptomyces canus]|uniref:5-deoxy-glucuronate isomerase n=1 Tax=Streptomyces canus TaxID=58343 RepID=UPI002E36683B|nr:5-deoxy-glucuronate isomerase [Streptomyces canus]